MFQPPKLADAAKILEKNFDLRKADIWYGAPERRDLPSRNVEALSPLCVWYGKSLGLRDGPDGKGNLSISDNFGESDLQGRDQYLSRRMGRETDC